MGAICFPVTFIQWYAHFTFSRQFVVLSISTKTVNNAGTANHALDPINDIELDFYGINALAGLTDFDLAQNLAPDWLSYTRYCNEDLEPYNCPDTLLPPFPSSSPPPMSSSPAPSEFLPSMSLPPHAQISSDYGSPSRVPITDDKGKKRARDEVDVRDILPAGSRRAAHRPTRVPVLVVSMDRIKDKSRC